MVTIALAWLILSGRPFENFLVILVIGAIVLFVERRRKRKRQARDEVAASETDAR
jgi:preprotein translocase subunit YajC